VKGKYFKSLSFLRIKITSFHSDDPIHNHHITSAGSGPGAAAANQQDFISQFQHSNHGYHHNPNPNQNINWYPQQ
jgi:hypothetical protein